MLNVWCEQKGVASREMFLTTQKNNKTERERFVNSFNYMLKINVNFEETQTRRP